MTRPRPRPRVHRRGATVAEFAIVAPVLLLVMFAMFEFSRMNVIRHTADNAAYEAARMAMVPGATVEDAVAEARRLMSTVGARGVSVNVTPDEIDTSTDEVVVEVTAPMNANAIVVPRFTRDAVIRSRATLRTERVKRR